MKPGGIAQHKSNCKCCICKAKRGENRGENNPCYKEKIVKSCIICKETFKVSPSLVGIQCCSRKCEGKRRSLYLSGKNSKLFNKNRTKEIKNKIKKTTKEAMKRPEVLFKIFKTWFKKGNHASVMSEFKCGELHPSWQGGKSFEIYPQKFNVALKERIKKRDNYKCQNCEMTQEEHLIVWGRDIEIHHIDYDKENCKEDNLITLCKQCNMRANYNREYWQLYFEEKILINVG